MSKYVIALKDPGCKNVAKVGGKAANLHLLTAAGYNVPSGFCITTNAYRDFVQADEILSGYFTELAPLTAEEVDAIALLSHKICEHLYARKIPESIVADILRKLNKHGVVDAYAVRSSSDSEDSLDASFAGIHETYLNVTGEENLLTAVRDCWLSLFSERAIAYRINKGFRHSSVAIAVVVQKLVVAEASGVMFTADPVNNDRDTVCIDANFGLGESIVSGTANADHYRVTRGKICDKRITVKHIAANIDADGGIDYEKVALDKQNLQVLPDYEILQLAALGQSIRKTFASEQDIEWCWCAGEYYIVQSRPITTLFPVWQFADNRPRILFSYAHWQMMTRPISPLGCSLWRLMFPIGKKQLTAESSYMAPLAGRLYIDGTEVLYFKIFRKLLPKIIGLLDVTMGRAVAVACNRPRFLRTTRSGIAIIMRWAKVVIPIIWRAGFCILWINSAEYFTRAAGYREKVATALNNDLAAAIDDAGAIKLIQESAGRFEAIKLAHFITFGVLSEKCIRYLFRKWSNSEVDFTVLTKAVPNDISGEMGLAFGNLAEMVRDNVDPLADLEPSIVAVVIRKLIVQDGKFVAAMNEFLGKYGMRCSGEVDVACPRWRENAVIFAAPICNHIRCNPKNQQQARFRESEHNAGEYMAQLVECVGQTRGGWVKARIAKRLLEIYRNTFGLREYPKYLMMTLFDIYRKKLLAIGNKLAKNRIIGDDKDVFWLSLDELYDLLKTGRDNQLLNRIAERKTEYSNFGRMQPPRVITESGEIVTAVQEGGSESTGCLFGTAVSAGVATGRARIVFDPSLVQIERGDILIAPYTDPGWTPLFMSASALVTEIGGLMTHGTVVAREYGIPAVTCVDNATTKICDGQIIRVDGNRGCVEIID
ncbi:MAG: phosphoenolpyruvate synthase [Negativicutes bacterium]|jgi:pyruvate,water dikinase